MAKGFAALLDAVNMNAQCPEKARRDARRLSEFVQQLPFKPALTLRVDGHTWPIYRLRVPEYKSTILPGTSGFRGRSLWRGISFITRGDEAFEHFHSWIEQFCSPEAAVQAAISSAPLYKEPEIVSEWGTVTLPRTFVSEIEPIYIARNPFLCMCARVGVVCDLPLFKTADNQEAA